MWGQTGVRWMQAQTQRSPRGEERRGRQGAGGQAEPPQLPARPGGAQGDAGAGQEHGLSPPELGCVLSDGQKLSLERGGTGQAEFGILIFFFFSSLGSPCQVRA